jgi:hypothetical protein
MKVVAAQMLFDKEERKKKSKCERRSALDKGNGFVR